MSALAAALLEKIKTRRARTGVVGLGYVGLPLAVELAKAGFHATGIDLDGRKIAGDRRRPFVHPRRLDRRRQDLARQRQARRDDRLRGRRRIWTPSTSACPRHCGRRRTRTCPTSSRRWNRSPATCIPGSSSASNRRPTPGRPRKSCSRCSKRPGSRRAAISSWRSRPSASIPATRRSRPTTCRRSSAA